MSKQLTFLLAVGVLLVTGCAKSTPVNDDGSKKLPVGIAFESLQTEYWAAGYDAIKAELEKRDIEVLEAIADQDPNRQLQQVKNFVTRRVDGIIMVPIDAKSCIPAIRSANKANIPIALFNRPAGESDVKTVAVQADNFEIAKDTVAFMVEQARKTGRKYKAMIVMGDLGSSHCATMSSSYVTDRLSVLDQSPILIPVA